MLAVAVFVYGLKIDKLCVFFAFIALYVQLPGLFVMNALRVRLGHISSNLIVGFFTGWALIIAEYFITDVIKNNILLIAIGPILSAFYVYKVWSTAKTNRVRVVKDADWQPLLIGKFNFNKLSTAFCVFVVLVLLYAMINTQYVYLSPELSDFTYMNADKAYHMGLIDSLSHDYPLQSPWVQGRIIHYHIFTEMLYAVAVRLFGLSADFILMSCSAYFTTYILCLSLYALFKEFCDRKDRAGIYSLLVILSNIYITRNITKSIAFKFCIINDNAAGCGIAACLVVAILVKYWMGEKSKSSVGLSSLLVANIMLLTGIKGPMGAVMIAGIWGAFILGLILRQVDIKKILPLLIMTAGFVLIYATILGSKGQSNGEGESIIAFATIANIAFWKPAVIAFMKRFGIPKIARLAVVFIIFMIFLTTAYFLPFCIGYIRELILVISKKKGFDFGKVTIYAATFVGLLLMFVLNYSGHSQIYFGLVSVFFVPIISYWYFEDLECRIAASKNSDSEKLIRYGKALKVIFLSLIVLTTISFATNITRNLHSNISHADAHHIYEEPYMSMSTDEYEAMEWIEENTPEDSLLATDRYYSVPLDQYSYENRWANRFFLYAVYSNRFCYIAGSGYNLPAGDWVIRKEMIETNNQLYDINNEARGDLARELGVDYVVVSKRFTDIPNLENEDYDICYDNDEVTVYEVKDVA